MPESTPIYGFTYPCEGEPVDAADFTLLATQIDTQMSSIQADEDYATGRYVNRTGAADQAGIVAGVETVLVNAGSTYVVPVDGVYWVCARARMSIAAANLGSSRLRIRLNAVTMFGQTFNGSATSSLSGTMTPVGAIRAAAGDTISQAIIFFGTGPGTATSQRLNVRQIVRIF